MNFTELRNEYPEFIYESYNIKEDEKEILLEYKFKIPNCTEFNPNIRILKKDMKLKQIEGNKIKNMVFSIGLIVEY